MKLIYTHDGVIGWDLKGKVVWCDNRQEVIRIGWAHVQHLKDAAEYSIFEREIEYAINYMAKTGDSIANFGTFGSFMYTTTEPEHEF